MKFPNLLSAAIAALLSILLPAGSFALNVGRAVPLSPGPGFKAAPIFFVPRTSVPLALSHDSISASVVTAPDAQLWRAVSPNAATGEVPAAAVTFDNGSSRRSADGVVAGAFSLTSPNNLMAAHPEASNKHIELTPSRSQPLPGPRSDLRRRGGGVVNPIDMFTNAGKSALKTSFGQSGAISFTALVYTTIAGLLAAAFLGPPTIAGLAGVISGVGLFAMGAATTGRGGKTNFDGLTGSLTGAASVSAIGSLYRIMGGEPVAVLIGAFLSYMLFIMGKKWTMS
jgi:hypothetical protein